MKFLRKPIHSLLGTSVSLMTLTLALHASNSAYAQDTGFKIKTGPYTCELGRSIEIKKVATDHSSVVIRHAKRDYTMNAVDTSSGALRFEDKKNGRAWVVLVGNSMFLDAKKGQRLANNCVST